MIFLIFALLQVISVSSSTFLDIIKWRSISEIHHVEPTKEEEINLAHYASKMYGVPDFAYGKMLAESKNMTEINPLESGPYLEGDILIPRAQARNGIISKAYRWPNGEIPVKISKTFSAQTKSMIINECMEAYHRDTCIRFRPATSRDFNYVFIDNQRAGCYSGIGMLRAGNVVNLQEKACTYMPGTCIHELMHAVGFFHEQARSDRDAYVRINWQNIKANREENFYKQDRGYVYDQGVSYDYNSIMHYGLYSHSRNGAPTMTVLRKTSYNVGHGSQFSVKDIMKINRMYRCPSKYTQ